MTEINLKRFSGIIVPLEIKENIMEIPDIIKYEDEYYIFDNYDHKTKIFSFEVSTYYEFKK